MKDQIKPFDVSILSSYMGKWLTVILAVFVVAVTISALRSGHSERNVVAVCVASDDVGREAFLPLRNIIAMETRRAVTVTRCNGEAEGESDLWIMPTGEFLRCENDLGLEALYEISSARAADVALILSRPGDAVDVGTLSASDVSFAAPGSINGFLVQLSMLDDEGLALPATASDLRFAGDGGERIALEVVHGASRLGACRQSELSALLERGVIAADEVAVVRRGRALPETIIASRREDAGYYRAKLGAVGRALQESNNDSGPSSNRRMTIALLRSSGVANLHPVDPARLEAVRQLYSRFDGFLHGAGE